MHSAKRYLVIALSFAICMATFAAFAPRIAHAVTATLVQVVNSGANPVPVSDGATQYQATLCASYGTYGGICSQNNLGPPSFQVPATTASGAQVKRLVIVALNG